jgi:hypothetical protein
VQCKRLGVGVKGKLDKDELDVYWRVQMHHALEGLAAPADTQTGLFEGIEFVDKTDELASTFDDAADRFLLLPPPELSAPQKKVLKQMLSLLRKMSGDEYAWSDDALRGHPLWQSMRALAKEALQSFGWKERIPVSDLQKFYKGGIIVSREAANAPVVWRYKASDE